VPLQPNTRKSSPRPNPRIVATGIDYLDAAVDAVLAGTVAGNAWWSSTMRPKTTINATAESARQRLADTNCQIVVDTLDIVVNRAESLPSAPLFVPGADENPLAWLFYTSGSTGTPRSDVHRTAGYRTWLNEARMPAITLSSCR